MNDITLCVPYYCNPGMLLRQAQEWADYPTGMRVIVVDDGSPSDPANKVLPEGCRARIYRIGVDIPWNRNGARNLGSYVAETEWILHVDVDHVLPADNAEWLCKRSLDAAHWYRFARYRVGRADETRRKDAIPDDADYGQIKPHIDSFLCRKALYWECGGYDEDFSGSLGGSSIFLAKMNAAAPCEVFESICLHVYTRDMIHDASDNSLSRDRSRYERIRAEKAAAGDPKPTRWMRFPWERVR